MMVAATASLVAREPRRCGLVGATSLLNVCVERLRLRGFVVAGVATRDADVRARLVDAPLCTFDDLFGELDFDYLFSVANDRVLSAAQLARARVAAINYHDGPLPKYAGLRATRWAIVNGETTHGVTWHRMIAGVDAGNVLARATVRIAPRETTRSLDVKCFERAIATFDEVLDRIDAGDLVGTPQDLSARTFYPARRRIPGGGRIDWTAPAAQIDALVRSTRGGDDDADWGSTTLRLPSGHDLVVTETELDDGRADAAAPGVVVAIEPASITVATGAQALRVTRVRGRDGREIEVAELVRRARLVVGDRLVTAEPAADATTADAIEPSQPADFDARCDDAPTRFGAIARASPDRIALTNGAVSVTYGALDAESDRLAAQLAARGVTTGSIVAILLDPSPEFVATALAIWKCGGAYLPLEIDSPADRLRQIVDAASPALVVTRASLAARLVAATERLLVDDARSADVVPSNAAPRAPNPRDLAYVIFTSGSSGAPKGTLVEHGSLARFLAVDVAHHGITRDDRILQLCSLAFDASVEEVWSALTTGATLFLKPPDMLASFERFFHWCRAAELTVIGLFPAQIGDALDAMERVGFPASIRLVTTGGEAVRRDDVARWQAFFRARALTPPKLVNVYGLTETTIASLTCDLTSHPLTGDVVPIGAPLPGTRVRILDGDAQVATGEPGELCLGGFGVARGYLGPPELSAERFVRDPGDPSGEARLFRTGDRARRLADGTYELLGRLDRQVKLRGARVELDEVELALAAHDEVRACAAEIRVAASGGRRLVAFVVAAGPFDADDAATTRALESRLRAFVAARLPPYMRPHAYVFLERMPLTSNGKIARAALELPTVPPNVVFDAPRGLVGDRVRATFAAVLGLAHVSDDDDFFDLGGDSHTAVQLVAALETCTGVRLPLDVLMEGATVARVTSLVHLHRDDERDDVAVIPLRVGTSRALYCLQTHTGNVQAYAAVAEHLPRALTLVGLRYCAGSQAMKARYADLPSLARRFVERIVAHDPRGPYALLGYSWGGLLAHEIARQLTADGRRVDFLGLIGTEQRQLPRERVLSRLRRAMVPRELAGLLRRLGARALRGGRPPQKAPAEPVDPLTAVHLDMAGRYWTERGGPPVIHLIRERESADVGDPYGFSPEQRWRSWTGAEVRVHWTTGSHDTCMSPPHALRTAQTIVETLRDAAPDRLAPAGDGERPSAADERGNSTVAR